MGEEYDVQMPNDRFPSVDAIEIHFLIIGESLTRERMQLYSYHRETNPLLMSMKDELVIVPHAWCTKPPGTLRNVKKIMTFLNSETEKSESIKTHLVNVMKSAGFKTYWFSNRLTSEFIIL